MNDSALVLKRSFVLHFLAEAFQNPDGVWEKRFVSLSGDALKDGIIPPSFDIGDLREDHFRLFGSSPACPMELTLHLAENPFEQARMMAHMAGFYRAFGLEHGEGERADNLSVALSFLSFLTLKEQNAVDRHMDEAKEITSKAIADFTREFLSPGVAAFTRKLASLTSNAFYLALAEILRREIFAIQEPPVEVVSNWEPRSSELDEGEMTCGNLKSPLQS